jgi:fumarate reductase flavoprotein subunit
VNRDGLRFCDETASYGVLERVVHHQGGVAWVVFDEASRRAAPADRPALYKQHNPLMPGRRSPNWNDEVVAQMAAEGRLATAPTVEALATSLGLPPAALAGQVARYNAQVAAGEDRDFRKGAAFLRPILEPPFYGAEVRPTVVALTSAGLRIDVDGHVLGTDGQAIDGLFAAGECTGGVLGDIYVGSGNSWANCLVFGRAAGRAAAAE